MNTSKTKVMVFSKQGRVEASIKVDGEEIEQVDAMKYLGATLTEDGRSKTEIKIRIAKAKSSFSEMKSLLTSKELTLNLRKRLLNCYIYPIFLYGAETWTLTKAEEDKINAFEMWCLRRMGRISWKAKKTNEYVLKKLGSKRQLLGTVKQRQLQYFGHIKRHQRIKKDNLEGKVEGKRARGRQRTTWTDNIKTSSKMMLAECTKKCKNREGWRVVVRRPLSQR